MNNVPQALPAVDWFLTGTAGFFLVVYALPLLLCPLRWARWFQWEVPAGNAELAVYFGRCLGACAVAITALLFRSAGSPALAAPVLELVACTGVLLTAVHVAGAVQRTQPWTEDVEIGLFGLFSAAAVWLRLTLG